ncbi:MAG: tripartite tricarboxylate transporter substrate binding protein [Betaproteobacteria bacterium]|nr:tripartite tricarboxylate transporter substrate binding protein [Betaproteobacteria bacterium]
MFKRSSGLRAVAMLSCLAVFSAVGSPVLAQSGYPSKPIRIIVPFAGGSGSDVVARVIGEALSAQMGVPVLAELREGAGGVIGAAAVAKAPPDGYTLLSAATPMTVAPYLARELPFDPSRDFSAIVRISIIPLVVVTGAKSPYKTLADLIGAARKNPRNVNYATGGKGSPSHLEVELINRVAGVEMRDIPYKSFGQGLTDTIGGQVEFAMASLPLSQGQIQSGALRALAVGSLTRVTSLPEVPTLAEALGRPGHEATVWYGLAGPAGTPTEVIGRLNTEIDKALASPSVRDRIEKVGGLISVVKGAAFDKQIRSESERWAGIVKELRLQSN